MQEAWPRNECKRLARNAQLKVNCKNWCQQQMETGCVSGDKTSNHEDRKTVSAIYLSLRTDGTRYVSNSNQHLMMDIKTTTELWRLLEEAFNRNITFQEQAQKHLCTSLCLVYDETRRGSFNQAVLWTKKIAGKNCFCAARKIFDKGPIHSNNARQRKATWTSKGNGQLRPGFKNGRKHRAWKQKPVENLE